MGTDGDIKIDIDADTTLAEKACDKLGRIIGRLLSHIPTKEDPFTAMEKSIAKLQSGLSKLKTKFVDLKDKSADFVDELRNSDPELDNTMNEFSRLGIAITESIKHPVTFLRALITETFLFIGRSAESLGSFFSPVVDSVWNVIKSIYNLRDSAPNAAKSFQSFSNALLNGAISLAKMSLKLVPGISLLNKFGKSAKKASNSFSHFNRGINGSFKTLLRYGLGVRSTYALINKLRRAIIDGFKNLAQVDSETNQSLSMLMSSFTQLKNAVATAAAPLLNAIAPALNTIIQLCNSAATAVANLIAVLSGKSTFIKATKVQQDYAASLDKTGKSAKEAKGQLTSFDKLEVVNQKNDSGGGSGSDIDPADMFETVNTEATALTSAMAKLFKPFQESWNNYGKGVLDSFKFAIDSISNLAKSIGRDFLTVWDDFGYGKFIVSDMLQFVTSIFNTIGYIASALDKAWNTNDLGLRIWKDIGDIVMTVSGFMQQIAQDTEEWAKNLDLYPLLNGIEGVLSRIEPIIKPIFDIMEKLYKEILLPIAEWIVESALPTFLDSVQISMDLLADVLEDIQPILEWLIDNFIKPIGEAVGDKVIEFWKSLNEKAKEFGKWVKDHKEETQLFVTIVGGLAASFLVAAAAVTAFNVVAGILATTIGTVIAIITGPVGIVLAIAAFITWILSAQGKVTEFKETVKQQFEDISKFIKDVFTGDWESAMKDLYNIIADQLNGIMLLWDSAVNCIIDLINKIDFTLPDFLGGYHFSPNLSKVSTSKLPRLATGSVIPPNASQFAAILGDNNKETEVVSPLSTMKQALLEALQESGGMSGDINLTVTLDGDIVYKNVVKKNRQAYKRNGYSPLVI